MREIDIETAETELISDPPAVRIEENDRIAQSLLSSGKSVILDFQLPTNHDLIAIEGLTMTLTMLENQIVKSFSAD
jgi:hypothetical protein